MDITVLHKTPRVGHGVAVITTSESIWLAGVTAIFPDLTCDVIHHGTTLTGFEGRGQAWHTVDSRLAA
jgi:hypothetical protein